MAKLEGLIKNPSLQEYLKWKCFFTVILKFWTSLPGKIKSSHKKSKTARVPRMEISCIAGLLWWWLRVYITNTFIEQYSWKRWNMKHREHRKMQLELLNLKSSYNVKFSRANLDRTYTPFQIQVQVTWNLWISIFKNCEHSHFVDPLPSAHPISVYCQHLSSVNWPTHTRPTHNLWTFPGRL